FCGVGERVHGGHFQLHAFHPEPGFGARRPVDGDARSNRADSALSAPRPRADPEAWRFVGDAGDMTEALTRNLTARPPFAAMARYGMWVTVAALFAVLPLMFRSGTAITVMSLAGISIVFALSYNMLLGQTGMLSFGHAVYYGFGAFFAVHCMNAVTTSRLPVPLPVIPLVGGLGGLIFATVFGWVSTRRSGTAFAMITLGLA